MELAEVLGRVEITRSLRTGAYRRACVVATLLDARVERFLLALRRARRVASDETIRRLCERFAPSSCRETAGPAEWKRRVLMTPGRSCRASGGLHGGRRWGDDGGTAASSRTHSDSRRGWLADRGR
jgi:hypothetical protein